MNNKSNIVLDIDDTLIKCIHYTKPYIDHINNFDTYSKKKIFEQQPELKNIIKIEDEDKDDYIDLLFLTSFTINNYIYLIFMRPYLREFLIYLNEHFNIYIYSLGTENYITEILKCITNFIGFNPFIKVISNSVDNRMKNKNLLVLNIPTHNTLIIDDRADVWEFDKPNLYNIKAFNKPYEIIEDDEYIDDLELSFMEYNIGILNMSNMMKHKTKYKVSNDNELYILVDNLKKYFHQHNEFNIYKFMNMLLFK